jgi:hypothetical protein
MKRIFGIIGATLNFGVLIVTSAGPASAATPPSAATGSTGGGYADLSRLQEQQRRSLTESFEVQEAGLKQQVKQSPSQRVYR